MKHDHNEVLFDFMADWYAVARKSLEVDGYKGIPADDMACSYAFFESKWRRISKVPRRVELAPEFQVPEQHTTGFNMLRARFEAGDDLAPNMSRTIFDAAKKDLFLNDWGIHHFHLGAGPHTKKPGFLRGTKELALAWVAEDAVYFIKIGSHGQDVGNATWGDLEILDIVDRRWPRLLDPYDPGGAWLPDDDDGQPKPTADEVVMMRRFTTLKKLTSGRLVLPPGGGNTMSGNSFQALRTHNRILTNIQAAHERAAGNVEAFLGRCALVGRPMHRPIHMHLRFDEEWNVRVEAIDADGTSLVWTGFRNLLLG
jgi:hypothetical protein